MNSLMPEVSAPHRPIRGRMTFLEAPGGGSLLGVSVSASLDTASHTSQVPDP